MNNTSPSTQLIEVQGIWNITVGGTGITAALNQAGDSINGRCKFEGAEPWNGVIAGSLSGSAASIAVAAMHGEVLVSTEITGTISGGNLQGRFVSCDSDGNEVSGMVTGTVISPDVADYSPVKVRADASTEQASNAALAPDQQHQAVQLAQPGAVRDNQATNRRARDVTELARGINPVVLPWSFPL